MASMLALSAGLIALIVWGGIVLFPPQAHRTRERLEGGSGASSLHEVTALVPARNEAAVIAHTLEALCAQGTGIEIIVVDDRSSDGTADVARAFATQAAPAGEKRSVLTVVRGKPLPQGWSGKLWALQQGLAHARRPYTLLVDADIVLGAGMVEALLHKARQEDLQLVSIMARLRCERFWERMLVPPFVFFFKLLYPFAWVNQRRRAVAAAAGGCVLVETRVLEETGAFESLRGALIDDCALAAKVKGRGHGIWLGMSDSVVSRRAYPSLSDFWHMVTRTAYTQLRYSIWRLILATVLMSALFLGPLFAIGFGGVWAVTLGVAAILAMLGAYWPTARFYELRWREIVMLPLAGVLYLAMTWSSAVSYWRGTRATWKNRSYGVVDRA